MPEATFFIQCYRRHVLASENLEVCASTHLWVPVRIYTVSMSTTDIYSTFESVESVESGQLALELDLLRASSPVGPNPKLAAFWITQSHLLKFFQFLKYTSHLSISIYNWVLQRKVQGEEGHSEECRLSLSCWALFSGSCVAIHVWVLCKKSSSWKACQCQHHRNPGMLPFFILTYLLSYW